MRFEDWEARLRRTCGHYYGVPGHGQEIVDGHVGLSRFHGLDMADIACDLDHIDRSAAGIRRDESEYIFLIMQLSGRSLIDHMGRREIVEAGEFYLLDSTKVARILYADTRSHFLSVHMPRGAFLLECDGRLRLGRALKRGHPMSAPMQAFLGGGKARGTPRKTYADPGYLFDLTRIAFTPGQTEMDASRLSSRDNRFELAVSVMERNLARPDLSLSWLARVIGISERQLQRDFLGRGTSFIQLLREKRLALAAEFLVHFGNAAQPMNVTDVALRSGFNDISNFNRSFKGRYGCSPSSYARLHA